MTKFPAVMTRRTVFRAVGGMTASAAALPLLPSGVALADDAGFRIPLNGNGFYRFKLGEFQLTVISDGFGDLPISPIFVTNAPEAELNPLLAANFMRPTIQGTVHALLIETGKERVLIDTGFGKKFGPTFGKYGAVTDNLRNAGVSLDSIDVVVLSHGHMDHIGGLVTKAGDVVFPQARHIFADAEWNYWTRGRFESDVKGSAAPDAFKKGLIDSAKEILPAVAERTKFVKLDAEIVSGVHFVPAIGHTPAHAAILVTSGSEQLLYLVDVAPNPVTSLQHPEWTPIFDQDPAQGVRTRKVLLDRAATDRSYVMAAHFPFPTVGHVERQGAAYRWLPVQWAW